MEFVDLRNLTSHTYEEEFAKEVLSKITIFKQSVEEVLFNLEKFKQ